MQTQTVLRTIRWIESLFSEETKGILTDYSFWHKESKEPEKRFEYIFRAINNMAKISTIIEQNRDAVEILSAFHLSQLLDIEYLTRLTTTAVIGREERLDPMQLIRGWNLMISCVDPLEALTTPKELKGEKFPEDILSFEIRYVENRKPTVADLSKATELIQELYSAVARIYGKPTEERLAIVKLDSGSSIRIDCKGIAELVKHLKDFFIEAWNKLRHKRAEEVIINNKALLSSLVVMDEIATKEKKGSLCREEAERIRKDVLNATFGLFERGTLLADIPVIETVDNTRLLGVFNPKLLPAPEKQPPPKLIETSKPPKPQKRTVHKKGSRSKVDKKDRQSDTST